MWDDTSCGGHAMGCWRIAAKERRKLSAKSSHDVTDVVVGYDLDLMASRYFVKAYYSIGASNTRKD
jgi:hypothetical protein